MVDTPTPLGERDGRMQAVLFHARERRKSLAGVPEMHRSARVVGTSSINALIPQALFTNTTELVTFKTAIIITGALPQGLVFEYGDATAGVAVWIDDNEISFHAGSAGVANGVTATFDNTVSLPDTLQLDLVAAIRPGDGRAVLYGNGREIARSQASNSNLPLGWASVAGGSFAEAVNGTTVADVTQSGAPSDFDVTEGLSIYKGQVPRQFW